MSTAISSARNRLEVDLYLPVIKSVLSADDIAEYSDITTSAVGYWLLGKTAPRRSKVQPLGELAAAITFFKDELSFSDEEAAATLRSISLDPVTYEPVKVFELIKNGNCPAAIQRAIELSIVE